MSRSFVRCAAALALALACHRGSDQPPPPPPPPLETFVELESDPDDWIGGGQSLRYTNADARITVAAAGGHLSVTVAGDEDWSGDFQMPSAASRLEPGVYVGLSRYPFHAPAAGGLSWSGQGRGCNTLTGSFTVQSVTYASDDTLLGIDVRFEQHCGGGGPALRGRVHWLSTDTTQPPGPVNPPPLALWTPAAGVTPATGNFVYLASDAEDFVGAGGTYTYTPADSMIQVVAYGGRLEIDVSGDESWSGDFEAMDGLDELQPGYYGDLQGWPFHNPARGGLDWWGEGRGCGALTGWFAVDAVTYSGGALTSIDLRFEQHCSGGGPALRGQVRWASADTTQPAGPVSPPPDLWAPAPDATPATGSFVYLASDPGDWVGAGGTYTYTPADAALTVSASAGRVTVGVNGDESWSGDFQAMAGFAELQPGYYGELQRYPFHNPARGGLSWYGEGRGCNTLAGWFVVDGVTYSSGSLTAIDLRFEQHCEGWPEALRGRVRWDASDPTLPPGPVQPPPADLWAPAPGATPATGNFVYLVSDPGDYIGAGRTYTYTQADAVLSVGAYGGELTVGVDGDQGWSGKFEAMSGVAELRPGYYGNLQRWPFHNPVRGGLSFGGEGRGCNTLTGWFVVDDVTYSGETLTAIDLRFEQHCEGGTAALRGRIRWDASDPTLPPGPVSPPPELWAPAPGATPATGNFVHLVSDPGDYIGAGRTYTYTQADAVLTTAATGGRFTIRVDGDEGWRGDFEAMVGLAQLQPGYYGNLQRHPFHNPARGGLDWSGEGRGCNTLSGWFAVDSVTYSGGALTAIDLRFEQHCEGRTPALRGRIRWDASDTTQPPGPVSPPPPELWTPAPEATPATGNFVYLVSDPGDYIGAGRTYTYTQADALLAVSAGGGAFTVGVDGDEWWSGRFQAMSGLEQLQPGYYGNVQRWPFHNPTRGGLDWSGEGRGCNTLTGWFAVDAVTYSGETLTAIDLRFEQRCAGGTAALRGRIRWDASDPTQPPGPVSPPPAELWAPAPGATPATGNFVHLASDPGDYIGGGATYTYTPANAVLTATANGSHVGVHVEGAQGWWGDFEAMAGLPRLEPGYYGNLRRWPFHNPARGGLDWWGSGRGCNALTGWFVVDTVTYSGDALTAIDLRFEQHCEGAAPALRGQVRWAAAGSG